MIKTKLGNKSIIDFTDDNEINLKKKKRHGKNEDSINLNMMTRKKADNHIDLLTINIT